MYIHKKNCHMIDERIRQITLMVESLAKFYKSELVMKRWNVKDAKSQHVSSMSLFYSVKISIKSTILMSYSHFQI